MTTNLTVVPCIEDASTNDLTAALDTARPVGPDSYPDTDVVQALDVALLLTDSLSLDEVAVRLGIPVVEVVRSARAGYLTAMTLLGHEGTPLFPEWQFTDTTTDGVLPHLCSLLHRVPEDVSPVVLSRWMTTPQPALTVADGTTVSPRVWLLYVGEPGPVLDLAPRANGVGNFLS